jgi:choline-sulfatase
MPRATSVGRGLGTHAIQAERPSRKPLKTSEASGPVEDMYAKEGAHIDAAVDWLHTRAPGMDCPWTMTIGINPPHPPYTTEPKYWDMYQGLDDLPEHGIETESAQHPYAQDVRDNGRWDYEDDLVRDLRRGYFGAISYVDDQLGRLLDAVDDAGLSADTVICYCADHGEMLGKFGMWGKTSLYEDAVRIPMLAAGPGFELGRRVTTPVTSLDLQATLFRATGARRPEAWRGIPLQDIPPDDPGRPAFATYHGHNARAGAFMLRRGDWKLIHNTAAPHQLFNLHEDPEELENVWSDHPHVVAELGTELRAICDPEAVERDAAAVRQQQYEAERRLAEEHGPEERLVPWEEA